VSAARCILVGVISSPPERQALEQMLGSGATFRAGQLEAIRAIAVDRRRALVVQRTGWGKSAVYFIATRLLRDAGTGPTLLVSPLLALMRNQIQMAARIGIRAETINSSNPEEWERIHEELEADAVDLLLVSPERFANEDFRRDVLPLLTKTSGLLVIDEAHCISDWGHDFRPDYRQLVRLIDVLPDDVPVLCTTATANDRVIADIAEQLGADLLTLRGPLERESLALSVVDLPSAADRMAWLAAVIPTLAGSGIVYALTIADTHRVGGFLRSRGIQAEAYSGETAAEERPPLEEALLANELKVLVATSALGMGFDKPDLGFVIHYQSPGSPIAYYQQVGRAGRALEHAPAVLMRGREDRDIQDFFIATAFPPREQAEAIVGLVQAEGPVSIAAIESSVNVKRSRLTTMLKVLEVEGAVSRQGGRWLRTSRPWSYDEERVRRVTQERRDEQGAMDRYASWAGCLMEFLRRELDDPEAAPCGRCANCTGERWGVVPAGGLVDAARQHLRGQILAIEPRRQWPAGLDDPKGRIPAELQAEEGRALSGYGDGQLGSLVAADRGAEDPWLSDELVAAAARMIAATWAPEVTWVTCVPSHRHVDLVPSFARRLADALDLPFEEAVRKGSENRPQAEMFNSAQQLHNVWRAFEATPSAVRAGPVLLVDDTVDSRWTLTVVAAALREADSGPVIPFALADARRS
jgi:ATP-dependent DNA helicase RecQ